ncbi:hypothetical protein [Streptomyces sp. NPDC002788]
MTAASRPGADSARPVPEDEAVQAGGGASGAAAPAVPRDIAGTTPG